MMQLMRGRVYLNIGIKKGRESLKKVDIKHKYVYNIYELHLSKGGSDSDDR